MMRLTLAALVLTSSAAATDQSAQPPEPVAFDLEIVRPVDTGRDLNWAPEGREFNFSIHVQPDVRERMEKAVGTLIDPMFGELFLGPPSNMPIPFAVSKLTSDRQHRERLILDADRDGQINPKREVWDAEARKFDDRMWVSHDSVLVSVPFDDGTILTHELTFWIAYPKPDEKGEFDLLRMTRRSWMEGSVELDGTRYRVALMDNDNDLIYRRFDRWIIVPDGPDAERMIAHCETMARPFSPCWVGDTGFRLMDVNHPASRATVRLAPEAKRPPDDRPPGPPPGQRDPAGTAPTAAVKWHFTLDSARSQARAEGKPIFVHWTAPLCKACTQMELEVYRDERVVGVLGPGFICLALDASREPRLAGEHRAAPPPAQLILDADGKQIERHAGEMTAAEFVAWLDQVKKKIAPEPEKNQGDD